MDFQNFTFRAALKEWLHSFKVGLQSQKRKTVIEYYGNGQPKTVWLFEGEKNRGYENFDEAGRLIRESRLGKDGFFINRAFYKSGRLRLIGKSKKNMGIGAVGEWKEYYENGWIKALGSFDDRSLAADTWEKYYPNGKKETVGTRMGPDLLGEWKHFDEEGILLKTDDLGADGKYFGFVSFPLNNGLSKNFPTPLTYK